MSDYNNSFVDSGFVDLGSQLHTRGLTMIEVWDSTAGTFIGAALIAIENSAGVGTWAAVLASSARATAPTPTFTVVGSAVRVQTAGATGHTIWIKGRNAVNFKVDVRV